MSNDASQPETFVGAKVNPADGAVDLSHAARSTNEPSQNVNPRDNFRQRFLATIQEAANHGLEQTRLINSVNYLENERAGTLRSLYLSAIGKEVGLSKEAVHNLLRRYQKEKIRANEDGELFHYHQTSYVGFEDALEAGGLLSYDLLKLIGKAPQKGSGSRKDVVQMTRDRYDSEGNLISQGLVSGRSIGAKEDIALVFDSSIMDDQDYDCIDAYPNLPSIPMDKLHAVLVPSEDERQKAQAMLSKSKFKAPVMTRQEWETRTYSED